MTELVPKPTVTLKKRSQVKTACINCRKSKTGCSSQRPCRRCCSLGLEDTCHDAPRKKRGKKLDGNISISYQFFKKNKFY